MADKTSLLDVIELERARHPRMDERDLQKLIYQSVFGGDHLLDDSRRYAEALREEWSRLHDDGPEGEGAALQSIEPAGTTARIHLAPCKLIGVELERLIDLLTGQGRKRGRREDYVARWETAIGLAADGEIPFSVEELKRVGFPTSAPHHGPAYGFASYRIVNDVTDSAMAEGLRRLGVR